MDLNINIPTVYLWAQLNLYSEGLSWCGKALELDELNIDVLCDRAELYIKNDMFDEAIKDYQTAHGVENHPKKVSKKKQNVKYVVWSAFSYPYLNPFCPNLKISLELVIFMVGFC